MAVSMADIQHLRKMSGAGMMDCKKALEEAGGDYDKAMEIIRKKGQAVAAKREDREAAEGCVLAGAVEGFAAIVAMKCETDFVAKNADFVGMAQAVLDAALAAKATTAEQVLELTINGTSVKETIINRSGITGEKMEIGYYATVAGVAVEAYIHPGNRLATIVAFNEAVDHQIGRDVAMQIAAMSPVAATRAEVPAELVEKEFTVAKEKAREEGKPEAMLDKIAEGRINKYYKESVLMEQEFVKDPKVTIKQYLQASNKELTVTEFKRFTLNAE